MSIGAITGIRFTTETQRARRTATENHEQVVVVSVYLCVLCASVVNRINPDDQARVRDVSDPQLSPDGGWVAYTVSVSDTAKDEDDTDHWLASADGRSGSSELRGTAMDDDLNGMSRERLVEEVRKLRRGIRVHRDSTGHELCWHHPALWGLLPEKQDPLPVVPDWPQFLQGCIRYRQSLD